jgi:hypothetical protein
MMNTSKLEVNLRVSARLAEKILTCPLSRGVLTSHFGGIRKLKVVLKQVSFTYRHLPYNVLAETSRNTGTDADFNICLSNNFEKHFRMKRSIAENFRVRFLLAMTIAHEVCHLVLRKDGIMYSPDKMSGLGGSAEAGEFYEICMLHGVASLQVSNFGRKRGWDPATMHVEAVVVKEASNIFKELCDSEIMALVQCAINDSVLPKDAFPITRTGSGRKRGRHVLKTSGGIHECTRGKGHGAARALALEDENCHIVDAHCALSRGQKRRR